MKRSRKILIALAIIFIILQFFRPVKNHSDAKATKGIATVFPVPPEIDSLFRNSCYDCHSNNTHYPWYAEIQPVGWWLASHIKDGKRALNFDEYATYNASRKFRKLGGIMNAIDEGEMPLSSYTLIHTSAKLSDAQKQLIGHWCEQMQDTMKAHYPEDSLKKPKK